MAPIVFLLGFADLIALAVAYTTGCAVSLFSGGGLHFVVALAATVLTLLVHCLVLLYFLGTGKSLQEAVDAHRLDPSILAWTREAKRLVFPLLGAATLTTVATAIVGGGADTGRVPPLVHGALGTLAVVLNLWAFYRQIIVMGRNSVVIAEVKKQIVVEDIFDVLDAAPTAEDELPPAYVTGRNLVFVGVNAWVPYVYMVIVMRMTGISAVPFAVFSVAALVAGAIQMARHWPRSSRRA